MFTLHALIACDHVADSEDAHMPHVQLAAGIREHRQAVKLLFAGVFFDLELMRIVPVFLGVQFHGFGVIRGAHGCGVSLGS